MFENFNDGYHANRLHQFVQDFCPSANSAFPAAWDDSSNVIFRTAGYTHIDGGFNATHRTIMPVFPQLTDEERTRSTFALIPPTLCFGTAPDQCFFFLVRPKSAGTIDVEIGYLFHPSALEDPLFEHKLALSDAGVQVFVRQDQDATTKVQRGLQLPVRTAWAVLVAGGESRAVQPLARAALPEAVADPGDRVAPPDRLSSRHGLTISPTVRQGGTSTMRKRPNRLLAGLAALMLIAAACGDDDDSGTDAPSGTDAATAETSAEPTDTTAAAGTETTAGASEHDAASEDTEATAAAGVGEALDTNGDGKVVFGIAAAGPADDGAYYQAVVDAAKTLSEENGFGEPIVVDNIQAADAATAIADLAQQPVDVIIVGASEIAEPLPQLIAEYPDIYWYCNCGAGLPRGPGPRPEHRRRRRDRLHGGLRDRPPAAGAGRRRDDDHRMLRPRLREAGVPGVRARPARRSTRRSR